MDPYKHINIPSKQKFDQPVYISVDTETSGPHPDTSDLLSIGAIPILPGDIKKHPRFYVTLKPVHPDQFGSEEFEVHRLQCRELQRYGAHQHEAMQQFKKWLDSITDVPMFLAYNVAFDWSFTAYAFWHYLEMNPFHHHPRNIKDFGVGAMGKAAFGKLKHRYLDANPDQHHALGDAIHQAKLYRHIEEIQASNLQYA